MNFTKFIKMFNDFRGKNAECRYMIQITNKTVDKKSSHNPYMQDYARFFVQFLIGY